MLVGMIMVLLSINHLFAGNFDTKDKDTEKFREEVRNRDEVITDHNLFRQFLRPARKKTNYGGD